jgi:hypothetical protein
MKLFTSGCSLTHQNCSWAYQLANIKGYELHNYAFPCIGNGIIAKRLIYNLEKLNPNPEETIVGVMWSAPDRHEFYINEPKKLDNIDGWVDNPINVTENKNWFLVSPHWETKFSKNYYEEYHTTIGNFIRTIENILLVQSYLKNKGYRYFMTTMMNMFEIENANIGLMIDNEEISYLYNLIDKEKFLPVRGCYNWVIDNLGKEGIVNPDIYDIHPNEYGHKTFTENVILPFLNNNQYL